MFFAHRDLPWYVDLEVAAKVMVCMSDDASDEASESGPDRSADGGATWCQDGR